MSYSPSTGSSSDIASDGNVSFCLSLNFVGAEGLITLFSCFDELLYLIGGFTSEGSFVTEFLDDSCMAIEPLFVRVVIGGNYVFERSLIKTLALGLCVIPGVGVSNPRFMLAINRS